MDAKARSKPQPRRKRCQGGLLACKNWVGEYKDVEGVGCCEKCDAYVDENPYDPYWEQMEQDFSSSKEYEEAYQKFQEQYESWPVMRRRMAAERYKRKT